MKLGVNWVQWLKNLRIVSNRGAQDLRKRRVSFHLVFQSPFSRVAPAMSNGILFVIFAFAN